MNKGRRHLSKKEFNERLKQLEKQNKAAERKIRTKLAEMKREHSKDHRVRGHS
jgi:hypothetical protein